MACLGRCSIVHSSWLSFSAAARTSRDDFLPIQMKTSDQQSRMYTLLVSSRLCSCGHRREEGVRHLQAFPAGKHPACSQQSRASPSRALLAEPPSPRAQLEAEGTRNQSHWSDWENLPTPSYQAHLWQQISLQPLLVLHGELVVDLGQLQVAQTKADLQRGRGQMLLGAAGPQ